jgi:hypothetical protein
MEATGSSETSVPIYDTTRNIPAQVLPSLYGKDKLAPAWNLRAEKFLSSTPPSVPPSPLTNAVSHQLPLSVSSLHASSSFAL